MSLKRFWLLLRVSHECDLQLPDMVSSTIRFIVNIISVILSISIPIPIPISIPISVCI